METLVIQSTIDNLPQVEAFVADICDDKHLGRYFATISVAVGQAVENAIVHGNRLDETKQVTIGCTNTRGGIVFTVADEGEGFDYVRYSDFPAEDAKGEGLFMMRMLADQVEYSRNGSMVSLQFAVRGIVDKDSDRRIAALERYFAPVAVQA